MPIDFVIKPLSPLTVPTRHIVSAARSEGYRFVDRLIDEWQSGSNRFEREGEAFLGAFSSHRLVAFGGLNRDPYIAERVARIRHLYVLPEYRRMGIGRQLVTALLLSGQHHYSRARLRSSDAMAANFYEALGFSQVNESDATHTVSLPVNPV